MPRARDIVRGAELKSVACFPNPFSDGEHSTLLKVVHEDFFDVGFDVLGHKFEVLGVDLIIVLRFFGGEDGVQGDLVGLVHDGPGAGGHFADVKMGDAGDVPQKFVGAGDDFIGGVGFGRVGPKYNYMREHA